MIVNTVKFLHLLCVLGLLGVTTACLLLVSSTKFSIGNTNIYKKILRFNKYLLILITLAMLTGTTLVHPKHFTFHTPWIQAAYLFVVLFVIGISGLIGAKKVFVLQHRGLWLVMYFLLITILIAVTHDAVTKTTFVF
jgi:hypothetical protein